MALTPEQVSEARSDPKLANVLYHDWEAGSYDDKWSISYDERCITYVRDRFTTAFPGWDGTAFETALELGCGTGFFSLNLTQAGVISPTGLHVADISPGMVEVAVRNAQGLGLKVEGRVADAEGLPYDDDTFDLVVGHAVLHHIPDLDLCLREVLRVLKPGGRFVFAGEPTRHGDVIARRLSRVTWEATMTLGKIPGLASWLKPAAELHASSNEAALEHIVDLHTFPPAELRRIGLRAGAVDVDVHTEELTSSWFGWPVRTFEAAIADGKLGWGWARFAYGSWQRLTKLDLVLGKVVPAGLFYNALITGLKP